MKKSLIIALVFAFFVVNGAIAGSSSIVGDWSGKAREIFPDGTIIEGITFEGTIYDVDGGLFSGKFYFTLPEDNSPSMTLYATGYIKAQKIEGTMSREPDGDIEVAGFFNAKLKDNKLVGVLRSSLFGSTMYFQAKANKKYPSDCKWVHTLPSVITENNVKICLDRDIYTDDLTINGNDVKIIGKAGDVCFDGDWTTLSGKVTVNGNNVTFKNIEFEQEIDENGNDIRYKNCCFLVP